MRIYSLTPKDKKTTGNTKSYIEIKTASGCVHSATEAQVFAKELGHLSLREVGENISFCFVFGQTM